MLESLNELFTSILGDASTLGAKSWLEALTWLAAVGAAFYAAASLRSQALQSRATLLLTLYERWEELRTDRYTFDALYKRTKQRVLQQHANLQSKHQTEKLRAAFVQDLEHLKSTNASEMDAIVRYLTFFETLGAYVQNRYLPMRAIVSLYKGPILEMDVALRDFIASWQKQAHMPPGLLANALALMRRTRFREDHPWLYALIPFKRWVWR